MDDLARQFDMGVLEIAAPRARQIDAPDGAFVLTSQEVTLWSTAVSGVGIILSVGALAFLGLWWGRNFRCRRVRAASPSVTVSSSPAPDGRVREPVPDRGPAPPACTWRPPTFR